MRSTQIIAKAAFCFAIMAASATAQAAPVLWSNNGHYYELIGGSYTWDEAFADAPTRTFNGMAGYLATIASSDENDFVFSVASGDIAFIGASLVADVWAWRNGPEIGEALASGYSNWGLYQGLPDSSETHAGINWSVPAKTWDDFGDIESFAYVIEYGDAASVPEPETYSLMVIGLGLLGFIARRRCTPQSLRRAVGPISAA